MNALRSARLHAAAAACLSIALMTAAPAHADTISDAASVLDLVTKAAPGALPFTGDDLRGYHDLIAGCGSAPNADDVIACVDGTLESKAGQQTDIPSWLPQMIDVYFDIEHKDYWGFFEDAGEAAACAAANYFAGGVDVCGAVQEFIDAAKAVGAEAATVVQFIEDLGTDLYCFVWSCGDSAAPPAPEEVAYQTFFVALIPEGLGKRMVNPATWKAYAGSPGSTNEPEVISKREPTGFPRELLLQVLPRFTAAVYQEWDSNILQTARDVIRISREWNTAARAQSYVAAGMAAWKDGMTSELSFDNGLVPLLQPGHKACIGALAAAHGLQVDDWVHEGRQQLVAKGFKWPGDYQEWCHGFDQQLQDALAPFIIQKATNAVETSCKKQDGNPPTYLCGNTYSLPSCVSLRAFEAAKGLPALSCSSAVNGPGKTWYVCTGGGKKYQYLPVSPLPKKELGCTQAKLKDLPADPNATPN